MWLRCALHAHTTNSDGELSPAHLARHYERAGYDVLCITDHWVRTVEESTDRLLVLPGIELNATLAGTGSDAHVLGLGIRVDPREPGPGFPDLQDTVGSEWLGLFTGPLRPASWRAHVDELRSAARPDGPDLDDAEPARVAHAYLGTYA